MNYKQKLLDPRWQRKRLEILQRDEFRCTTCFNDKSTLHVHHLAYTPNPWDISNEFLITLCEDCHKFEHEQRPEIEKQLLATLRKRGLPSGFLIDLNEGFECMEKFHVEDVMGSVFNWLLKNEDLLIQIKDLYFESLKNPTNTQMAGDDMPF